MKTVQQVLFAIVDNLIAWKIIKGLVGILNVEGPANPEVFKVLDPQKSAAIN